MSIYREIYVQILGSAEDVYLRYLRESWQWSWQINVGFARDRYISLLYTGYSDRKAIGYLVGDLE